MEEADLNIKTCHFDADEWVAAVDLGSNSFHMIVARLEGSELQIVDRWREPVRLAFGLDANNRLSTAAQRRACECLSRFACYLQGFPQDNVRVVGTHTFRKASNAADLLTCGEQILGYPIAVISGVEEARLIYLGAAHSLMDDDTQRLVIDIGGGSSEFIIGVRYDPLFLESLQIGCVSLSRAYFDDGYVTAGRFAAAEATARAKLQLIETRYRAFGWDVAIGAAGTIRRVFSLLKSMDNTVPEGIITLHCLKRLRDWMIKVNHVKHLDTIGLSWHCAPVFPGGLAILIATFEALKIDHLRLADGALREGLLYDRLGQIKHEVAGGYPPWCKGITPRIVSSVS